MTTPDTRSNVAVVERVFEAWNAHDRATFRDCHAEDVVLHGSDGPVEGVDDLTTAQWGFFDSFSDLVLTLEEAVEDGDTVALRYTASGTQDGPFMGTEPSGRSAEFSALGMVRVEDGLITEKWVQIDAIGLLQQLGITALPTAE